MSGIATAIIGSAVVGGVVSSRAAGKAVDAQTGAADQSIAFQERALEDMRKTLSPFTSGGEQTLAGQLGILGMGPEGSQQAAIDQIEQSPMFQALARQGEQGILQNASATGGLRGGNTQAALAQFRPALLNQQIQQQFQNLGGITRMGQASAAGVGDASMQTGQNVGNVLMDRGQAIGQGALAQGQAFGNIAGAFGTVAGMSDPTKGFGRF